MVQRKFPGVLQKAYHPARRCRSSSGLQTRPGRNGQRRLTPRMKAREVMMMGLKRRRAASSVASTNPTPAACRSFAELDDEDGIFCRKPDRREQPDLEVDVVGLAKQQCSSQCPQNAHRHDHDDGEQDRPALRIQGRKARKTSGSKAHTAAELCEPESRSW